MEVFIYIYSLPPAGGRFAPKVINAPTAQGEGRVYEAYEVKNKRQKMRCLLLRRKKKNIIYLFMK